MKGRAKPVVPMAFYTVYTCAVVAWLMIRVPGFNTLKELNALSIAVGMIGESSSAYKFLRTINRDMTRGTGIIVSSGTISCSDSSIETCLAPVSLQLTHSMQFYQGDLNLPAQDARAGVRESNVVMPSYLLIAFKA